MKPRFLIVFLLLSGIFINNSNAQWVRTGGPQGGQVYCLESIGNEIWAGTSSGINISKNEGKSWKNSLLLKGPCFDILNSNDSIIIIYEDSNSIVYGSAKFNIYSMSSFDKGKTWSIPSLIETDPTYEFAELYKAGNTLISKNATNYFTSHDFGTKWSELLPPFGSLIKAISVDKNRIFLITMGSKDIISLSTNGALSWQLIDTSYRASNILSIDSIILLSITNYNYNDSSYYDYLVRSVDTCKTWDTVLCAPKGIRLGAFNSKNGKIYVYSNLSKYESADDGKTWTLLQAKDHYFSGDEISFPNKDILSYDYTGMLRYVPSQDTCSRLIQV